MNGKLIVKTPFMCEGRIKIDGKIKTMNPFKKNHVYNLPQGKYKINVGISYDEMPESSKVHSADTWAWEKEKNVILSDKEVYIILKRKWHLLKPVTAEAVIKEK